MSVAFPDIKRINDKLLSTTVVKNILDFNKKVKTNIDQGN